MRIGGRRDGGATAGCDDLLAFGVEVAGELLA